MLITMNFVYRSHDNYRRILMILINIFFVAQKLSQT